MRVSSMRSFGAVMLGLGCILFFSGCATMVLERPLSESNEFQDANLDGVWMMVDMNKDPKSKDRFVFVIENVENHHYAVSWMLPAKVSFTISQISDDKNGAYRFACICAEEFGDQKKESYTLVRYTSSPDEIGIYSITKALQDGEDFKKLCQDPSRANLVTAGAEEIRKWCKNHAEEMELLFTLKRVHFKTESARQKFLHISKFFPAHLRRMAAILAESKDADEKITDEQKKKIRAEFETARKWVSDSGEMISPELAVIFDQYQYLSMLISGRKGNDVRHDIQIYTDLIAKIAILQLLE